VDDFYIYYELGQQAYIGTIKAIAPSELNEMGDMEFIRVPSEVALSFTKGSESLNRWVVKWLPEFSEMRLYKQKPDRPEIVKEFLQIIPTRQTKPQVIVTWKRKSNTFNVRTRGISITNTNMDMNFFVTRLDDPNIYYHHFSTELLETMNRRGLDIPCNIVLPKKFSVCTKTTFDRYQLRIER